jgi:predicted Zn-dependent peptidase
MVAHSPPRTPRVKRYVGDNGVTVLHERNPYSRAFCIGVWLKTGSRDEGEGEWGMSHFLEHMLFKGTRRRSAFEISQALEKVGGSLDAFTTKEQICVYAQVLRDHANLAVDVLDDMFLGSVFPPGQVEVEKQVILGEIRDVMDAPDDLIHDLFASEIFPHHPLGKPILGTTRSVSGFSRDTLLKFSRRCMKTDNVVVSVFGVLDRGLLRTVCDKAFRVHRGSRKLLNPDGRAFRPVRRHYPRKLRHQHLCIGTRSCSYLDDRRYPQTVLTTLLGGGMSSRLFQRIREELGLAYSVFTYAESVRDTGIVATYMAVKPGRASAAVAEVFGELDRIRNGDVRPDELRDTKEQLKGRILLGLETASSRMMRNARNEIYYGRQVSEREIIEKIDRVTLADVLDSAPDILDSSRNTVVSLGPSSAGLGFRRS